MKLPRLLMTVGVGVAWFLAAPVWGQVAASRPVGIHKVTFSAGANFFGVPLHGAPVYTGLVASRTTNSVTFTTDPGWPAGTFAQATIPGWPTAIPQFALVVTRDAAASPGVEGDWWLVAGASGNTVTIHNLGQNILTNIPAGSTVEVRELISIRDLFGAGADVAITKDSDFTILSAQDDYLRSVAGTSFRNEIFYHDGSLGAEGWYFNGRFAGDGSTIRLAPTDPLLFFRRTGAQPLTVAIKGQVQIRRLSTYLAPGPNPIGTVFPVNAPIGTSALKESGWISDTDFDVLATQEDYGRVVQGTRFGADILHYAGNGATQGWYVGGVLNDAFPLEPARGYMLFRRAGAGTLIWRQNVPFSP
jgi:uncharacterized protein (TIGR02597 family)